MIWGRSTDEADFPAEPWPGQVIIRIESTDSVVAASPPLPADDSRKWKNARTGL
jgi:hypothetical protein